MQNKPECDIAGTQIMVDLFQVPKEKRDDSWKKRFYNTVQTASYRCADPQIFKGPDGFPYFALLTPEPNKGFESFCIRNLTDYLLENGIGVALNPRDNGVDWVFSYGDIVNLHLNNEFYSETNRPEIQNVETIKKEEKILIAQPSEKYFPKQARKNVKRFLQQYGVTNPMVMLVTRPINGKLAQELAFNVFAEDFKNTEQLNYMLKQISWYLPRHYIMLSVPQGSDMAKHFAAL